VAIALQIFCVGATFLSRFGLVGPLMRRCDHWPAVGWHRGRNAAPTVRVGFVTISDILRRSDIFVAIALQIFCVVATFLSRFGLVGPLMRRCVHCPAVVWHRGRNAAPTVRVGFVTISDILRRSYIFVAIALQIFCVGATFLSRFGLVGPLCGVVIIGPPLAGIAAEMPLLQCALDF